MPVKFFNMKPFLSFIFSFIITINFLYSQNKEKGPLTNAVVIGQFDLPEDRYSIEISTTQILNDLNIKAYPSLNILKFGSDAALLASDSIQKIQMAKGYDVYLVINVRGYDRRYKKSTRAQKLSEILSSGTLFQIHREDITSVSFELSLYKNDSLFFRDIIKCGNISDRGTVIKRYSKKLLRRVSKKWKKKLNF